MSESFILASTSSLKRDALAGSSTVLIPDIDLGQATTTVQPIGMAQALECCKQRIDLALEWRQSNELEEPIIAIENFIDLVSNRWLDRCLVMLWHPILGCFGVSSPLEAVIPEPFTRDLTMGSVLSETIGQRIHRHYPLFPANDWFSYCNAFSRTVQIRRGIAELLNECNRFSDIQFAEYRDFPKPGIVFADMFSQTLSPEFNRQVMDAFALRVHTLDPSTKRVVLGIESRGLMLGYALAIRCGLPFLPIRKPGKLPGPVALESYAKEYGQDSIELQKDYCQFDSAIIVDDVIATGGSMLAACRLAEQCGVNVDLLLAIGDIASLRPRWQSALGAYSVAILKA